MKMFFVNNLHMYFFTAAGNSFCQAAELQLRLQSRHEAATHYVDAGNCYKKADPNGLCFLPYKLSQIIDNTCTWLFSYELKNYIVVLFLKYQSSYIAEAVNCLTKAIEIYADMVRKSSFYLI